MTLRKCLSYLTLTMWKHLTYLTMLVRKYLTCTCQIHRVETSDMPHIDLVGTSDIYQIDLVSSTSSECSSDSLLPYTLLDTPVVKVEFKLPYAITSVCPTKAGEAWTCDVLSNTFGLLDKEGHVMKTREFDDCVVDFSLSLASHNLWLCTSECDVIEMETSVCKPNNRFRTDDVILCICVTDTDYVVVGTINKVTMYTSQGHEVHTITSQTSGLISPVHLTQCPVTGNIALSDSDDTDYGGENKPGIMILDNKLSPLYRYTGEDIHVSRDYSFHPRDLTYDSRGNLVIRDWMNDTVELVSGTGQYIKTLLADDGGVRTLGMVSEDELWIVRNTGDFCKILQYHDYTVTK